MFTKSKTEDNDKDEATEYKDEYTKLSKNALVQECKMFNDAVIKPKKCIDLLNKCIYLLNQGEKLSDSEKTTLFFGVTKLFLNDNSTMRRLIYVFIKELKAKEDEVFIVTSCLSKDMMSDNSMYKANALRVLSKIVDKSNLLTIEKLIKTSLTDKNTHVKNSALVSCIHLFKDYPEMVKKLVGDIQNCLMSGNKELQYHALLLLHEIKKDDPMAILKILSQLKASQTTLSSKLAKVQLIRYIKELLTYAHLDQKTEAGFVGYLNECLTKNPDMVSFEAAKSICELSEKLSIDHEAAFKSILDSLVTGESILKFSSLRVLNRLATINPKLVSLASSEIEPLINDSNTSIASMAISTLLKVCTEAYVQKLLAQISHYLPDLGDDFKIEVIHSVYLLFCRVPTKSQEQINFLLKCLTGEGTEGYKESIVEALMKIGLEGTTADLEQVLLTLCEFIEDCDFKHLQTHIMNFIANESYKTSTPSIYIRFIYKRVVLEKSIIRAAAVSALGTMAHKIESLRNQIVILLKNCSKDENDEVRERVLFYINLLDHHEENEEDYNISSNFTFDALNFDPSKIENYLIEHKDEILENEDNDAIFDFDTFCTEEEGNILTRAINKEEDIFEPSDSKENEHNPLEEAIEEFEDKGHVDLNVHLTIDEKILESIGITHVDFTTGTTDITSPTDEYFVQVTKHFHQQKIIFVFSVKNNIEEHKLADIKVSLLIPADKYNTLHQLSSDKVGYPTIVLYPKDTNKLFVTDDFKFKLTFTVIEIDGDGNEEGSYDDEYQLDKIRVSVSDYIGKQPLQPGQFANAWEMIKQNPECTEKMETFQINFSSMKEAVIGVINFFGMSVCENSDAVEETSKVHNLFLAGTFYGAYPVLIRGQIGFNSQYGCVLRVGIRSLNDVVIGTVLECIQ